MNVKRISKIAGVAFAGFCAASFGADKANLAPVAAQLAGFIGAFAGTLVASNRKRLTRKRPAEPATAAPAEEAPADAGARNRGTAA